MVSTELMSPTINVNIDCLPHKEWLKALERETLGREIKTGREGKGKEVLELYFQTSKVESCHAYRPLFCVATKGRTMPMRKQCQEADLN